MNMMVSKIRSGKYREEKDYQLNEYELKNDQEQHE